jgi:putative phage-type endonuclease
MQWLDIKQGSPEWHELRRTYYKSASRTPIVLGISPFKHKKQLADEILNDKRSYQNEAMKQGVELEEYVRDLHNKNNKGSNYKPKIALDGEYLASLDGYSEGMNRIIEIKVSDLTYEEVDKGEIPKHYYYQIQHQLMVTRAKRGYLIAYSPTKKTYEIEGIKPEPEKWEEIKRAWDEFDDYLADFGSELTDDESLMQAESFIDLTNEKAIIESKIQEIKDYFLEKSLGAVTKVGNLTISKSNGRASYDYKGFLDEQGLKLPNEFIKEGKPSYRFTLRNEK